MMADRPDSLFIHYSSQLPISPEQAWAHACSMAGVNYELAPLMRMTHPADITSLDTAEIPLGRRAFRSWILLGGILPVEYDDLTLVEITPGQGFLERSPMLLNSVWQHERRISARGAGCVVSDNLRFTPRIAWLGPLLHAVYILIFQHRHRRLRQRFG